MQKLVIVLVIVILYWMLVEILKREGIFEKHNITVYGPVLLIRTEKGLNLLDNLSKHKSFWKKLANIGLPLVFFGMFFMFSLLIYADFLMILNPPKPSELTSPRAALLIPGINPFIPIVWGTIGLIVTLIVHEFSHAILCRVENIKVRAMGLIFALIPLGGFAEPDEKELRDKSKVSRSARIRIFSAGVTSNFAVAFVAFFIFIQLLGFVGPKVVVVEDNGSVLGEVLEINGIKVNTQDDVYFAISNSTFVKLTIYKKSGGLINRTVKNILGVKILGLYREKNKTFPAERVGIKKGMLITKINGKRVKNSTDFRIIMSKLKPRQNVTIEVFSNGSYKIFNVTLENMNGRGFLGVYIQLSDCLNGINLIYSQHLLDSLKSVPRYFTSIPGWLYLISMPFRFQGFIEDYKVLFNAPEWLFWFLNAFYWIGWMNFYVGLFNCLPAIPLDGGRVFHEALSSILSRRYGERADKISIKVVKLLAVITFMSIILSIAIPNLGGLT